MSKITDNFKLDYLLLTTENINFLNKINFLISKYYCILLNKRKISYLGSDFYYDNRFAPAILEEFPKEISNLDKDINLSTIRIVLDVGANIGQFSFTLKKLYPQVKIFAFEPNKEPFRFLKKNMKGSNVYNYGLGISGKRSFFCPESSTEGSLYDNGGKEIKVEIIDINKLNIPKEFDLVKIDVEGAELEVLKSLKDIKFRYLFIEDVGGKNLIEINKIIEKRNPNLISFRDNLNALIECKVNNETP